MRLPLISVGILPLAFVVALLQAPGRDTESSAPPVRVVGYLASWGVGTKGTSIARLPAKHLTHIFYAFALISKDGSVVLGDRCVDVGACGRNSSLPSTPRGNFAELERLKARYPHLKLAISIGGWVGRPGFPTPR